jgi:adenylosuccinate lyase
MQKENVLKLNKLTAISPIDGRYADRTAVLRNYFSEYALIHYRIEVELEYFKALCDILPQLKDFPRDKFDLFDSLVEDFFEDVAWTVKAKEAVTKHDVKAIEYYLRDAFDENGIGEFKEFIHFGLTSYDINSVAWNMMLKDAIDDVLLPELTNLSDFIGNLASNWRNIPMLAHTHGQPASPTRLGKEIGVFVGRLNKFIYEPFGYYHFEAKFGGATGNFNAHYVAYPDIDWHQWADKFLMDKFGFERQQTTTQIESYDNLAELFDVLKRINTVFIDMSRDMWSYISMNYFNQKPKKDEVGSSAMPHKVNPIDFENGEGNAGIAIVLFEHLSTKLPVSRLQRDLSGSTVERIIGVPFAHMLIAISSFKNAFGKVEPNIIKIMSDLDANWAVVTEGIQTILRREGYPDPYGALKELTRNGENELINHAMIINFIDSLEIGEDIKEELKSITPINYVGK